MRDARRGKATITADPAPEASHAFRVKKEVNCNCGKRRRKKNLRTGLSKGSPDQAKN